MLAEISESAPGWEAHGPGPDLTVPLGPGVPGDTAAVFWDVQSGILPTKSRVGRGELSEMSGNDRHE
jgi:hypothetical protein